MDATFGDWLKAAMDRAGLKQEAFADLMGVRQGTVSRWVNGGDIKVGYIWRMADVLGVRVEDVAAAAAGVTISPGRRPSETVTHIDIEGVAAANPSAGADLDAFADRRRYVLIVDGDCLAPAIDAGDALLMDREARPTIGKVVEIRVGGERHVKRLVTLNGEWVFVSRLGRLSLPPDGFDVVGVMVKVLTPKGEPRG